MLKQEPEIRNLGWLMPEWPVPPWVSACTTSRHGGVSEGNFASLNLAEHVGDDPLHVAENRRRLIDTLSLPSAPKWLQQVHGTMAVDAAGFTSADPADASFVSRPGIACAVLTADCLPVLLCNSDGTKVAAVHAGWRGLLGGIIENCVRALHCPGTKLLAWLGPAIGSKAFEVGNDVRDAFITEDRRSAFAFKPSPGGRWLADINILARQRLARMCVTAVYGGHWCTVSDRRRFYSYRRDGVTGRMASIIWMESK